VQLKKISILIGISFLSLLVGCGKQATKNDTEKVYNTKVTKVSAKGSYWHVQGTTNAPSGAKIIVTPSSSNASNYGLNQTAYADSTRYSIVKNNKFSTNVATIGSNKYSYNNFKAGQKSKLYIFAITNYHKKITPPTISQKIITEVASSFSPKILITYTSQINYLNSKKIESSNSSSSSSISSSEQSSVSNGPSYENKLNKLNKGTAEYATYDSSTNTVTWTGYDDWSNWSNEDLERTLDILQSLTMRQETKYGINNVHIVVQLPDGTVIAKNTDDNEDLQIISN
jgi:hypothetical protein